MSSIEGLDEFPLFTDCQRRVVIMVLRFFNVVFSCMFYLQASIRSSKLCMN